MNALNKEYFDFYDDYFNQAYSIEDILDEFYDETSIRVLRKPAYEEKSQEKIESARPQPKPVLRAREQAPARESNWVKIGKILLILGVLGAFLSVGVFLVNRYLEINEIQYKNTSMKNAINDIIRQKEMIIVAKANAISMENLEKYALEELDMIRLDQANTIFIKQVENCCITPDIKYMK